MGDFAAIPWGTQGQCCLTRRWRFGRYSLGYTRSVLAKLACSDTADIDNKILNNEIDKLEKELEQIYEQKSKGAQIRSREKWVEFGGKNNAYFLGLQKKRQIKKAITKLLDDEGNMITNQRDILDKIKYYKKLYTSTNSDKQILNDYIYIEQN